MNMTIIIKRSSLCKKELFEKFKKLVYLIFKDENLLILRFFIISFPIDFYNV